MHVYVTQKVGKQEAKKQNKVALKLSKFCLSKLNFVVANIMQKLELVACYKNAYCTQALLTFTMTFIHLCNETVQ